MPLTMMASPATTDTPVVVIVECGVDTPVDLAVPNVGAPLDAKHTNCHKYVGEPLAVTKADCAPEGTTAYAFKMPAPLVPLGTSVYPATEATVDAGIEARGRCSVS